MSDAQAAAARVEVAFANVDDTAFLGARWQLELALPCVGEELGATDVIAIHRAHALASFYDGDNERARRSLMAIRALQPDWRLSSNLYPPGHPIREMWEATEQRNNSVALPPNRGGWNIDGMRSDFAPEDSAFILQAFSPAGDVLVTRYCETLSCIDEAAQVAVAMGDTRRERARSRNRWIGVAGGSVVLVGGLAGLAVAADARHDAFAATEDSGLDADIGRAHLAWGTGVAGVALGTVVVGASFGLTW